MIGRMERMGELGRMGEMGRMGVGRQRKGEERKGMIGIMGET